MNLSTTDKNGTPMIRLLLFVAIGVLVLGAIVAVVAPIVLRRRAERLLDTDIAPVDERTIQTREARRPTFTMTVTRRFAAPPEQVWSTLEAGAFGGIPIVDGVRYRDDERAPGTVRTLDLLLFAAAEQVTRRIPATRLSVAGIETSIPLLVDSYLQDFQLRETSQGGTDLTWTVAGRPAIFAFVPLSWTAVFIRPFARIVLGQLAARR
ncbi:SRPBCC family protein [Nocardia sp. NPDC048505]|uniref:SRPBCC family protein n=1 Tax=unclassified Nocardia TaxID=2637762 RepID=UPI003404889E